MTYSIIISPPAEMDIREIQEYYDGLAIGLGERFILKFDEALKLLATHPKIYNVLEDQIRSANMDTFPYVIFFSIFEENNEIEILAVIHMSRNPSYWRKRINIT